jgi:hypothetical protein
MKLCVTLFVLAFAMLQLPGMAFASTMNFEGLTANQYHSPPYTENGITLDATAFWIAGPGGPNCGLGGCMDDGTNVAALQTQATVTTGSVFTLSSFDYAYSFREPGESTSLTITGNINGGGTYNDTVALNIGGGFTTAALGWGNLDSVSFISSANWFTLDNITVIGSTVPEPGSLALFGSGLVGLVCLARRRLRK